MIKFVRVVTMKKHQYLAEKATIAVVLYMVLGSIILIPETASQETRVLLLIIMSVFGLIIGEFVAPTRRNVGCTPLMEMPIYGYQSIKEVPFIMRPFYKRAAKLLLSELEANPNSDPRFIEILRYKLLS